MKMLQIRNLSFSYPGQASSLTYDLDILPGRINHFNGPSGSGKSTLLDLIAGFLRPDRGKILLDGRDLSYLEPEKRPVSILFQSDNLFDHLTVEKNLQLALKKIPPGLRQEFSLPRELENALEQVGLQHVMKRRASDLSGGEKQRVSLARTLLANQPVLLLDEPYASLDRANADRMRQLVRRLTIANNWHTLLVSHLDKDQQPQ